jgi:hypothetical protein
MRKSQPPPLPWEWLEIKSSGFRPGRDQVVHGWIPRWVAESVGLDCKQFDRPPEERAGTWINREQAQAMRQSEWWRTPEEFEAS